MTFEKRSDHAKAEQMMTEKIKETKPALLEEDDCIDSTAEFDSGLIDLTGDDKARWV